MEQIYADAEATRQKQRSARVWQRHTFRELLTLSFHSSLYVSIHVENVFIGSHEIRKIHAAAAYYVSNLPTNVPDLDLKRKLTVITK